MPKIIDSLVQASLDAESSTGVVLAKLHFDPIQRYSNAYQPIYWDEGSGEEEYIGLGHLASVSVLTETTELSAVTIQLKLSGIPNSMITDIFSDEYIGKPVYLYYATLNKDTYAVEGGSSGPVLMFAGRMDFGNIEFGETATITVNATSRLADWERPRGGRFNHSYQTRHVDATDDGFKYVQTLQDKVISWGGVIVGDPGSGGTSCFVAGTQITMSDYTTKNIEDVEVGDSVFSYNLSTNKLQESEVLGIMAPVTNTLVTINEHLKCTPEHPIYVQNKGWCSANPDLTQLKHDIIVNSLELGDYMQDVDGNSVSIDTMEIESVDDGIQTYNLYSVEHNYNYFANGLLVHNKKATGPGL